MSKNENFESDLELAEQEQELPAKIKEKKNKGLLRTGYTTGTCATAATKAALLTLIYNKTIDTVQVKLPKGNMANISIYKIDKNLNSSVTCTVIKDGGDDPDVTNGAEICSTVMLNHEPGKINIDGGIGVGRVTKPGLGLELGKPAINPVPMRMIRESIIEIARPILQSNGITAIISIPNGLELSKRTDNPRLGILGGISILGTTGIVLPYSTASFAASIRQSLDVGIALNANTFVLTTGGRSEDFIKSTFNTLLPDHSYIQMGDFAGYSIKQCAQRKVDHVVIAGFIGKLTKIAMGIKQTHVRGSHVNMDFLADIARECSAKTEVIEQIKKANTARHVMEIILSSNVGGFFDSVCKHAFEKLHTYVNSSIDIHIIMFDFEGKICGKYPHDIIIANRHIEIV